MLIVGSNCRELGRKVAELVGLQTVEVEVKKFPDNETYVRVPEGVKDENVFYIQTFYPNQNDTLIESFLTIDALAWQGAKSIVPIFPYFPYSKQDKTFLQGEALSIRTIFKIFCSLGIENAFFINSHFLKRQGLSEQYGIKCSNINVAPFLMNAISEMNKDCVIVLPGEGSKYLLDKADYDNILYFETRRDEEYKLREGKIFRDVEITGDLSEAKNRTVVVLDDMISTGGTMAKICAAAKQAGAKRVIASAVHGLFVGEAIKKLSASADEIISTDTIQSQFSRISVAENIAKIIGVQK